MTEELHTTQQINNHQSIPMQIDSINPDDSLFFHTLKNASATLVVDDSKSLSRQDDVFEEEKGSRFLSQTDVAIIQSDPTNDGLSKSIIKLETNEDEKEEVDNEVSNLSAAMILCQLTTSSSSLIPITADVYNVVDPTQECLYCNEKITDYPPVGVPEDIDPIKGTFLLDGGLYHLSCAKSVVMNAQAMQGQKIELFTLMLMNHYGFRPYLLLNLQNTPNKRASKRHKGPIDFKKFHKANHCFVRCGVSSPPFVIKPMLLEKHHTGPWRLLEHKTEKVNVEKKPKVVVKKEEPV
jgi:hypothetical protein